ncbi:MAG: peptidase S41 [Gammaproteobacteria bacterium]|nr:peptidase S41 [Gammaproteobacteria bacterium]
MKTTASRAVAAALLAALLVTACGGGGGGNSSSSSAGSGTTGGGATGGGTTGGSGACSLTERQNWVVAQMRDWYLYPETLPATIRVSDYTSVETLISAMTATARAQNKDRNFTYLTSIAEENALINSGASAGFGILLGYDVNARRVFILEAFEGTPALAANIDRGDEIVAIGTSSDNLRSVTDIMAAEGVDGVRVALGPSTPGTARVLRIARGTAVRTLSVTKADYALEPVSTRYGGRIIEDAGKRYGYLHLRTFSVRTADARLREEFRKFLDAGVTEFVIDLRYNGGGLVSIAELMGDLLGGDRRTTEVFSQLVYNSAKSARNSTRRFAPQPQSVKPIRMAFVTTRSSASASELVINGFIPYLGGQLALIGENTFGKPVGQEPIDNAACDDRLRVVAFTTQNSERSDAYFNGLAGAVRASCRADDDITQPLGSARESSIRQALDWLQGKSCTTIPVTTAEAATASGIGPRTEVGGLQTLEIEPFPLPADPTPAEREIPGLF